MTRIAFLILCLMSCSANAADAMGKLAINAMNIESIHGKFSQSRHIAVLSTPIVSSGEFYYQRENGLRWHVSHPVESTLEISYDKGIHLINEDGEAKPVIGAELLTQLFLGLFSGNLDALLDIFDITEQDDENAWQLHLTPKSDALRQHISHVDIAGQNENGVDAIKVIETSGDHNEIQLLEQQIKRSAE
ncbi:MAG: outer membrane lipoprotein carrier protein LolA [Gammaproteobacteria bacterium]|jgi:outer membrane lipoprotein-sorting protein|nr:outer membrane lipoprotein carrier protein LolA [Gammaproteobacteria bacterium]MBU1831160.1 outer membrane lipoprotein carrier protein LolA [Gammaproteobacteria bacterium]